LNAKRGTATRLHGPALGTNEKEKFILKKQSRFVKKKKKKRARPRLQAPWDGTRDIRRVERTKQLEVRKQPAVERLTEKKSRREKLTRGSYRMTLSTRGGGEHQVGDERMQPEKHQSGKSKTGFRKKYLEMACSSKRGEVGIRKKATQDGADRKGDESTRARRVCAKTRNWWSQPALNKNYHTALGGDSKKVKKKSPGISGGGTALRTITAALLSRPKILQQPGG